MMYNVLAHDSSAKRINWNFLSANKILLGLRKCIVRYSIFPLRPNLNCQLKIWNVSTYLEHFWVQYQWFKLPFFFITPFSKPYVPRYAKYKIFRLKIIITNYYRYSIFPYKYVHSIKIRRLFYSFISYSYLQCYIVLYCNFN